MVAAKTGDPAEEARIPNVAKLQQIACKLLGHRAFTTYLGSEPKNEKDKLSTLAQLEQWLDAKFQAIGEDRYPTRERWLALGTAELIALIEAELTSTIGSGITATPAAQKRRRPGRKADYAQQQREAKLADEWKRARDAGVYKADFAKERGMTLKRFDALLSRVAKQKARSDK